LELIKQKLFAEDYVNEEMDCEHCHAPLTTSVSVQDHRKACTVLKWTAMSAEERVGSIVHIATVSSPIEKPNETEEPKPVIDTSPTPALF